MSAATLDDVTHWVVQRTRREEMQTQILEDAASFYILLGTAVRFDELCVTSSEIALTANSPTLTIDDLDPPVAGICSIRLTSPNGSIRRLKRSSVRTYDAIRQTASTPATYARWGLNLEVNPSPSITGFTARVRYWSRPVLETNVGTTVILFDEPWVELIRYETLWRHYNAVEDFEKAGALVSPMPMPRQGSPTKTRVFEYGIIPKLWNDLLKTISQREDVDEDFGINPIVRNYTHV